MQQYAAAPQLTSEYLASVWEALPRYVRPTLLLPSPALSAQLGCDLSIASETFQHTGSFKFRAAYNLLSSIPQQHVITASSGNFGQAVAYACKLLGKTCTVVMPATSAQVKVAAVQSYGGEVDLIDVRKISRGDRVQQLLAEQPGAFYAQAYDDYRVVAGNSTLSQEILSAADFDMLVVPVGGGGLCSGQIIARDYLHAHTEIIGAEPLPGNDAARSLRGGQLISNEQEPDTVADGARTLSLGSTRCANPGGPAPLFPVCQPQGRTNGSFGSGSIAGPTQTLLWETCLLYRQWRQRRSCVVRASLTGRIVRRIS